MAKLFSVVSWNVEHFGHDPVRVARIANYLKGANGGPGRVPEIFALYEVEGRDVYGPFMDAFPDHRFHLTEGKQTQEIFVGVHKSLQSFTTQRVEFKTQRDFQRPGLFLTVRHGGANFSFLFLHIKSGDTPESFGLRDAALTHAFSLKKALDKAMGADAHFVFMGDINTMGVDDPVPYSQDRDFSANQEIARLEHWAGKRKMVVTPKTADTTWWNGSSGYPLSNLDHVVASNHMDIRQAENAGGGVTVLGWQQKNGQARLDWIDDYSDHCLLNFEVWG